MYEREEIRLFEGIHREIRMNNNFLAKIMESTDKAAKDIKIISEEIKIIRKDIKKEEKAE